MTEQGIVMLASLGMLTATTICLPLAIGYARRAKQQPQIQKAPPDVTARLDRIEQAVEAVATEVERIAEGQRFTTKLLTSRGEGGGAEPARLPAGGRQ